MSGSLSMVGALLVLVLVLVALGVLLAVARAARGRDRRRASDGTDLSDGPDAPGGRRLAAILGGSAVAVILLAAVVVRLLRPDALAPSLLPHELPKPGHVVVNISAMGDREQDLHELHANVTRAVEVSLVDGARFERPMSASWGMSFGGLASDRCWQSGQVTIVTGEEGGEVFAAVDNLDDATLLDELELGAGQALIEGYSPQGLEVSIAYLTADLASFRVIALVHDGERFVFRRVEPDEVYDDDQLAVFEDTWWGTR